MLMTGINQQNTTKLYFIIHVRQLNVTIRVDVDMAALHGTQKCVTSQGDAFKFVARPLFLNIWTQSLHVG